MKIGVDKLNDLTNYPPKFSIFAHPSATCSSSSDPSSPQLVVQGLDIEDCCFEIITPCKQKTAQDIHLCFFNQTIRSPLHCLPHHLLNHKRVSQQFQMMLNWSLALLGKSKQTLNTLSVSFSCCQLYHKYITSRSTFRF